MNDEQVRIMDILRGTETDRSHNAEVARRLRDWFRDLQASGTYDQPGFEDIMADLQGRPPIDAPKKPAQVVGVNPMSSGSKAKA